MDREHPIPQQISSYQFRLVGDMTIKQFFQVAAGALVAILIYSTELVSYIKWPLVVVSFLIGIAFAFFPLEDRPLPTWIYLFIKSIYSPTVFIWKQPKVKPVYFQPEPGQEVPQATPTQVPPKPEQTVQESQLQEIAIDTEETQKLEQGEQKILSDVAKHFGAPPPPQAAQTIIPTTILKPEQKQEVEVVKQTPVAVEKEDKVQTDVFAQAGIQTGTGSQVTPMPVSTPLATHGAEFSLEAAPPTPPTHANLVVGQVMDTQGKILENAILEIKDSEGRPVRALKSNKLGHFMIVTPLVKGKYEIITEKEGYTFEPITVTMKDEIVPPIAIKAKKTIN